MLIVSPRGHCMLCPYSLRGLSFLSIAKNLSIRVIRYFTALRSVQYDTCAWFVILNEVKNLSLRVNGYFAPLRRYATPPLKGVEEFFAIVVNLYFSSPTLM